MATGAAEKRIRGGSFLIEDRAPGDVFIPEDFSDEQRQIGQTTEEFIAGEVGPGAEELGLDKVATTLIAEKVVRYASFAVSHGAHHGIGTLPIAYFGTEAQKKKYLPKLAAGQLIAAYCLSEAEAGSDALAAKARADLSPD